jgi:hypothetical protein
MNNGTWYRNKFTGEIFEPMFWPSDIYDPADPPRPDDEPPYPGTIIHHEGDEVELALRFMAELIEQLEPYDPNNPPAPPPPPPPPPPNPEVLRGQRNGLLLASDWTQLPDVPEGVAGVWAQYRQNLRDVPQQAGFPAAIEWPAQPV